MSDSNDEGLSGAIDPVRPWTIRAISVEARDMAIVAGRKEQMSVGQWLERLIRRECEGGGSPSTGLTLNRPSTPALAAPTAVRPSKLDRIKGIAAAVAKLGEAGVTIDPEHARAVTASLVDALPPRKGS